MKTQFVVLPTLDGMLILLKPLSSRNPAMFLGSGWFAQACVPYEVAWYFVVRAIFSAGFSIVTSDNHKNGETSH
jgi:hypothetical protein